MDFLLLAVAAGSMLAAGLGLTALLRPRPSPPGALVPFAFPLGVTAISFGTFALGFWLSGAALRWTLAAGSAALGAIAVRRWREDARAEPDDGSIVGSVFFAATVGFVFFLSSATWLGWDGLLIWEHKARVAFLAGGLPPAEFFANESGLLPHVRYPLLLPLGEAWIYGWIGRPDQSLAKLLPPGFYLAAATLLGAAAKRFGTRRWQATIAPHLLLLVPTIWIGEGSATSGYADFPLATLYLAAVVCLMELARGRRPAALLFGFLAAGLVWTKQEGQMLFVVLIAAGLGSRAVREQRRSEILAMVVPPLVVAAAWWAFLAAAGAPREGDFLPFSLVTALENLDRVASVARSFAFEGIRVERWGLLWIVVAALVVKVAATERTSENAWQGRSFRSLDWLDLPLGREPMLLFCGLAPLVGYAFAYTLSAMNPFMVHVDSSLPRLMLHVAPPLLLWVLLELGPGSSDRADAGDGERAFSERLDAAV